MNDAPWVVVGGGVIGWATALELRDRGQPVLVVDAGVDAECASLAAAGVLAPSLDIGDLPGPLPLMVAAREMHAELARRLRTEVGVDVGFRRVAALWASDPQAVAERAALLRGAGYRVTEHTGQSARGIEPELSPTLDAALEAHGEAMVEPPVLLGALRLAAMDAGAQLQIARVMGLVVEGGRLRGVRTSAGVFSTERCVVCAGVNSLLLEEVGLPADALHGVRGQLVGLRPLRPLLRRIVETPEVYLRSRPDGVLLCGSTLEVGERAAVTTAEGVRSILNAAADCVPGVGAAQWAWARAGVRPATADGRPLLGPLPAEGAFISSAHYRHGVLLAPLSAKLIVATMLGEALPFDLAPWAPERVL